ncbi:hypothetical protein HanIR_Chr16g0835901 [Helianthus annuus]|nr:hypothetical protein HanIR_Chr16g0835901 [Helianthus annuus]
MMLVVDVWAATDGCGCDGRCVGDGDSGWLLWWWWWEVGDDVGGRSVGDSRWLWWEVVVDDGREGWRMVVVVGGGRWWL